MSKGDDDSVADEDDGYPGPPDEPELPEAPCLSDAPASRSCSYQLDESQRASLRLAMLPGLGPRTLTSLLDHFGSSTQTLAASSSELAVVPGVGPKMIHTIRTADHFVDVDTVLQWCGENGAEIIVRGSDQYPERLEDLVDPPSLLFAQGAFDVRDEIAVGVVGTRHATSYGLRQAEHFGYALANAGVTVVSGLARGVDTAAHRGALNGGGRTIAVLGGGLGQIYPSENAGLAREIAMSGVVTSEYGPMAKPRGGMFPQRNRIISGLSLAILVIEAPDRSGALITARLASEQGREALALPGPVTSRASRGCHQLIRDGATLVQNVDDVIESLGPLRESVSSPDGHTVRNASELLLNEVERQVLDAISETSTSIDEVIATCELPAHRVAAVVSVLEMRRLVRRLSGQYVSRI